MTVIDPLDQSVPKVRASEIMKDSIPTAQTSHFTSQNHTYAAEEDILPIPPSLRPNSIQ